MDYTSPNSPHCSKWGGRRSRGPNDQSTPNTSRSLSIGISPPLGSITYQPTSPTATPIQTHNLHAQALPFSPEFLAFHIPQVGYLNMGNWAPDSPPVSPTGVSYPSPLGILESSGEAEPDCLRAIVEDAGFISLKLEHGMVVDIAPNQAILISNSAHQSKIALSGCGSQMALIHPQGRILQYKNRVEIQAVQSQFYKIAKFWPRGISFTSNKNALVYLIDQGGVRSTTDTFHNLFAADICQGVFDLSNSNNPESMELCIQKSMSLLDKATFWKTNNQTNCWMINNVVIRQTYDGLVSVERKVGSELFAFNSSPNNGKGRLQSPFVYVTASIGSNAHIFVKSKERRLHYNGQRFVVRNGGHSAGFDETGNMKIW